jgi:hypothetical protein
VYKTVDGLTCIREVDKTGRVKEAGKVDNEEEYESDVVMVRSSCL